MPNITIPNSTLTTNTDLWSAYWRLTRGLKAAGWRYKASSDGYSITTIAAGSNATILSQATTIAVASNGASLPQATINVASTTGFSATGTIFVVTGAGTQTVTYTGITGTTFTGCTGGTGTMSTGGAVTAATINVASTTGFATTGTISVVTSAGTQTVTYTSTNGTQFLSCTGGTGTMSTGGSVFFGSKETTGNPSNDKWGGGVQVGSQTATASFTISTPTTIAKGGRVTLTGLTGFTLTSPGHLLTITGATNSTNNGTWLITAFISATSIVIENPAAIAETTPGTATWTEKSSVTDVMPTSITGAAQIGAWWCAEGPSTMRIPIGNVVPTISFVRGENVTQATTGATGEILGVLTDTETSLGYIVVAPRASGTGAAVRGWSSSNVITGAYSGATVTPTGTPLEFVREIVIWKNTIALGHAYFQVIDSVNESTTTSVQGRFSTMAALTTCTANICPGGQSGGNPLTNGFPTTGTYTIVGTGGPGAVTTGSGSWIGTTTTSYGVAQVMCANCIEDTNISPDGSYILAIGTPLNSPASFVGSFYQRLDDSEDGDIDPYCHGQQNNVNYGSNRTVCTTSYASADIFASTIFAAVNFTPYRGWRRRGFATADAFQEFQGVILGTYNSSSAMNLNTGTVDRVATAPVTTSVREPLWVISSQLNQKIRKGTCRWLYFVSAGAGTDTYDSKRWIQLSSSQACMVAGPWDGTTTPFNS